MPGVIMDNVNVEGSIRRSGLGDNRNGASNTFENADKSGHNSGTNGSTQVNGALQHTGTFADKAGEIVPAAPFELPHITQGFFPFGTLVNRSVQQCWVELSEVIAELAAVEVPPAIGKPGGNQSPENLHKKSRLLEFAHDKRAEFIKLLVLSQWSRQAADVSRLIDIQGFIRTRHQSYDSALQYVGEVKRDLVRAQVANPDLKTALEVLSKGEVASLPNVSTLIEFSLQIANIQTAWLQTPYSADSTGDSQEVAKTQPNHQRTTGTTRFSAVPTAQLSGP
jgi:mediator of RNA polymerase II transcription subunit 14